MKFNGATIITPLSEIEKMVLHECVKIANQIFPPIIGQVENELRNNIIGIFRASPEYQSLVSGELEAQFGLVNAKTKVDAIVDKLANSTNVRFVRFSLRGNTIHGGLRIEAIQSDFTDILSMNEAFQEASSSSSVQFKMPWLEWLLIEGDRVIISNYYFKPGSFSSSRSNKGIMVFDKTEYWRVPAQYSGTMKNNWVTRTIDTYITFISNIIENSIKRYL